MKIKGFMLAAFSLWGIGGALAQGVEYDDMYFNSEDRVKLSAQRGEVAYNAPSKAKKFDYSEDENVNPTDSYSARNVNPEYTSRAHTQTAQEDEQDYFVNNYQYNRNNYSNWNNDFNNWYNNPWYRSNYYGSAISRWNSPYYGYNSWDSPWYDPFWAHNGWSSSFSFYYGQSWNYGWGGAYNYWNRPYYGWNSWDPYYGGLGYSGLGYYGGSYWNNWRYPGTIIVVNNGEGGRGVVRGKRPTRGTSYVSEHNTVRSRTMSSSNPAIGNRTSNSGRMSTTQKQEEYYNRYNQAQRSSGSTYYNRQSTENNRSRSWSTYDNNSSYSPSGRTSSPSYSPSRSSGSSSGTGSSGSGTNGRSRGRN